MTKKTALFLILICCVSLLFTGCSPEEPPVVEDPQTNQDEPANEDVSAGDFSQYDYYEWSYVLNSPITHARTVVAENFVKNVYDATDGHVNITLYGTGELPYVITEYVSTASSGLVEITDCTSSGVSGEWPSFGVITYPFLCTNYDDFKAMAAVVMPICEEELAEQWNCRVLYFGGDPLQVMCGKNPAITSLADFANRKIRGQNAYVQQFLQATGASPITVTSNEIAEAMSHGMIDTFTTGAPTIASMKYYEYGEWFLDGALLCTASVPVISNDVWDTLPSVFQDAIMECAKIAEQEWWECSISQHKDAMSVFEEAGLTIYEMSEQFMQEGYGVARDMWYEWAENSGDYSVRALEAAVELLYN